MTQYYILILMYICLGKSDYFESRRIKTLELTEIQNAPFAVIVVLRNNKYFCTGTIISPGLVLTAAHCLFDLRGVFTEDGYSVSIIAGADKLHYSSKDVDSGLIQIRHSEKVIIHPNYSWLENFINDLALIKVKEPFNLTERISPVPMVDSQVTINLKEGLRKSPASKRRCIGIGFGKVMQFTDSFVDYYLKSQTLEVTNYCHCLEKIQSIRTLFQRDGFLCKEAVDYTGLCTGDNGGQLMCEGKLTGIATTVFDVQDLESCRPKPYTDSRNECGDIYNSFSVFTDISFYEDWIKQYISSFSNVIDS